MNGQVPGARSRLEYLIIFAIGLLIACLYFFSQNRVIFADGHPYDAQAYVQMAQQFAAGETLTAIKPFVTRIGLPLLAGTLRPDDVMQGFTILNFGFSILTLTVLMLYLRRLTVSTPVLCIILLLWLSNMHGPFRFAALYPAFTDTPVLLCILLSLYLHEIWPQYSLRKTAALTVLTIVGVCFREIMLVATTAILITNTSNRYLLITPRQLFSNCLYILPPLLAGIGALLLIHHSTAGTGAYTYQGHAFEALLHNLHYPHKFLLSLCMAFGPALILLCIGGWQGVLNYIRRHPAPMLYAVMITGLATFAGFHTDRFFYWTFPAMLPLFAVGLTRLLSSANKVLSKLALLVLGLAQIFAVRLFTTLPNADFDALKTPGSPDIWLLGPYGEQANFAHMYAAYMDESDLWLVLGEYAVVMLLVWVLFQLGRRRQNKP